MNQGDTCGLPGSCYNKANTLHCKNITVLTIEKIHT